ncbi:hypothetical protein [Alkalihalobacterium chitinilyticum]|uniref:Uncharacterized protein n=1 Tax=Alkalihalobacterium chitinilyticum TaxID=2980103 RepID=A0ABT5VA33_9BACI|nr:hypothetical protein [Alkalihalobacterium chitinilyticum]MDE5412311.1 hypothetical protein [Alkalihalobacterium chitinilyticum]
MKKRLFFLMVLLTVFFSFQATGLASELMDKFAIRITVIENGIIHEWEYDNPDKFEFETGNVIKRGKEAEKEVQAMISLIQLREDTKVEFMVKQLKENGYKDIERLDIRMINGEGKLFTWVWNKD